ncbi:MAG: TIGR03087 family PEP-CTERM/XrtA system glycosyltransferase [Planctomycetaceae bacterium]|nr:TIGR03087 family PEP-CTERM/XrtA system glycosyltransferase [Planctomycetaceae bacterium]
MITCEINPDYSSVPGSARPEVLYLVHRFPFPPNKGDRIRTFNIIRHLSTRVRLSVATLSDEPVARSELQVLSRFCHRLEVIPLGSQRRHISGLKSLLAGGSISAGMFSSPGMTQVIRNWCRQVRFDEVLLSSSSMLPCLRAPELAEIPAVADLIDVDSQKWQDYAEHTAGVRRWLYQLESRRLGALEVRPPGNVRAVTLVSQAEADLYRAVCRQHQQPVMSLRASSVRAESASPSVHAIPNGVDLEYFSPAPPATESNCVFVGAMDYRPNINGVLWFCREVFPILRRRHPQAKFQIVGRNPHRQVQKLGQLPGVEVTGSVPDVRPWVARASAVVAPLQIARGLQNKVIEAMAMAKPVIGTPEALTGLSVRSGEHILEASEPHEFAAAIERCFSDSVLCRQLGQSARRYTEQHHDWSRNLSGLSQLLMAGNWEAGVQSSSAAEEVALTDA